MFLEPEIHVVAVFSPSPYNSLWLDLQQQFLKETTEVPYQYHVYLNGCDRELFAGVRVIGSQEYECESKEFSQDHTKCLQKLSIDQSCEHFLLLDSDCFPIAKNWHRTLVRKMKEFDFNQAAPIRTENLDTFPHPSAMFFNREGFENFRPKLLETTNLAGCKHHDTSCSAPFFPLIRTNKVNIHPICAAIYYDLFYHHGAGSREPLFRSTDMDRYYEYPDHQDWVKEATQQLIDDPHGLINRLRR